MTGLHFPINLYHPIPTTTSYIGFVKIHDRTPSQHHHDRFGESFSAAQLSLQSISVAMSSLSLILSHGQPLVVAHVR